jgi:hypothetical protein
MRSHKQPERCARCGLDLTRWACEVGGLSFCTHYCATHHGTPEVSKAPQVVTLAPREGTRP